MNARILAIAALAAPMLAVSACSPQEANAPAPVVADAAQHPVSGLDIVPLTVTSGEDVHRFDVEVARSVEEQAKGLMFRTELGPNEGMIFPRDPPDIAGFYMKNTPLPLDIIFIGPDGRILNIAAETTPYSLDTVRADGLTGLVLELAGGRAAELGIEAGDVVAWTDR